MSEWKWLAAKIRKKAIICASLVLYKTDNGYTDNTVYVQSRHLGHIISWVYFACNTNTNACVMSSSHTLVHPKKMMMFEIFRLSVIIINARVSDYTLKWTIKRHVQTLAEKGEWIISEGGNLTPKRTEIHKVAVREWEKELKLTLQPLHIIIKVLI